MFTVYHHEMTSMKQLSSLGIFDMILKNWNLRGITLVLAKMELLIIVNFRRSKVNAI